MHILLVNKNCRVSKFCFIIIIYESVQTVHFSELFFWAVCCFGPD